MPGFAGEEGLFAAPTAPATMRPMKNPGRAPVRLSVSIVLYDSSMELFRRTLCSLQHAARQAHAAGCVGRVEVDVVDNSRDVQYRECVQQTLAKWPRSDFFQINYRALAENRGFGAGHNHVIPALDSDFHLVLNPDVELAETALSTGLESLRDADDTVLVSPRVTTGDGRREYLCKRYPSVLVLLLRAFAPRVVRNVFHRRLDRYQMRDACSGDRVVDVLLASGCFMLLRTAALRAVGGFDERYFLYFEDFDLSLRLGRQGRLLFNPAVQIIHHGGYAASKGLRHVRYFIASGITFFRQHGWRWI